MNVIATIWDWYDFTLFFVAGVALVGFRQPRRRYFWLRAAAVIALLIGVASVWKALNIGRNGPYAVLSYLEYFLPYLILIFGMWFCFECSFISAFFCATTGYLMQHIAQRIYMTSFMMCGGPMDFPFDFLGLTAISAAVYAAVYFLFIYRNKGNFCEISVDSVLQLFLSALAMLAVIFLDLALSRALRGTETIGIVMPYLWTFSILIAFVSLLLEFNLLSKKRLEGDYKTLQALLEEARKSYEQDKREIELVNLRCHDIRHQVRAMQGRLDAAVVKELTTAIDVYDSHIKTGNEAIDVVLAKYNLYCRNHKIRFTCMLDGTKLSFIPPHEMYALFGNAMENAIHAVEPLEEEKRIISITEESADGFVNISITNFYKGELEMKDGLPISRRENHGFGVKSMRMLAEKYNGRMHVQTKGEVFVLSLFFPLEGRFRKAG